MMGISPFLTGFVGEAQTVDVGHDRTLPPGPTTFKPSR
jgi:hypothetical protein